MQKPEIKAGMPLDIVFANERNQPNAHYMKAVVYERDKNIITISQTSPALTDQFLNRQVVVTFLVKSDQRILRFGFPAKILEINDHYEMSAGNPVTALLIKKTGELEPTDFRMYFRVKPPSSADLSLFLQEQKVTLIDISLGGAKFSFPRRNFFQTGDRVNFKLIIGNASFNIDAVVRNVREPEMSAINRNMQYVSVEFRLDDKTIEASLGRAVLDIERSLLSEGKM